MEGAIFWKDLGNGRAIYIYPLTYGRARLGIGNKNDPFLDDEW